MRQGNDVHMMVQAGEISIESARQMDPEYQNLTASWFENCTTVDSRRAALQQKYAANEDGIKDAIDKGKKSYLAWIKDPKHSEKLPQSLE